MWCSACCCQSMMATRFREIMLHILSTPLLRARRSSTRNSSGMPHTYLSQQQRKEGQARFQTRALGAAAATTQQRRGLKQGHCDKLTGGCRRSRTRSTYCAAACSSAACSPAPSTTRSPPVSAAAARSSVSYGEAHCHCRRPCFAEPLLRARAPAQRTSRYTHVHTRPQTHLFAVKHHQHAHTDPRISQQ